MQLDWIFMPFLFSVLKDLSVSFARFQGRNLLNQTTDLLPHYCQLNWHWNDRFTQLVAFKSLKSLYYSHNAALASSCCCWLWWSLKISSGTKSGGLSTKGTKGRKRANKMWYRKQNWYPIYITHYECINMYSHWALCGLSSMTAYQFKPEMRVDTNRHAVSLADASWAKEETFQLKRKISICPKAWQQFINSSRKRRKRRGRKWEKAVVRIWDLSEAELPLNHSTDSLQLPQLWWVPGLLGSYISLLGTPLKVNNTAEILHLRIPWISQTHTETPTKLNTLPSFSSRPLERQHALINRPSFSRLIARGRH